MTQHARPSAHVADFRDNLIIDRYDPVFAAMRASKRKHLHSVNSEDAVTWTVFRSLRQIQPSVWLRELFRTAFPGHDVKDADHATVQLWQTVEPPPALLVDLDERESEIDVIIQTPSLVWFIEAKLGSDISLGTTTRPDRDQVLRNIDVGSYYAGVRPFYFSLLIASTARSKAGVAAMDTYTQSLDEVRKRLAPHRPDGLKNVAGLSRLTWAQLCDVLEDASAEPSEAARGAVRADERAYARRALEWMQSRGYHQPAG